MGGILPPANAPRFRFTLQGQPSLEIPVVGTFGEVAGFSLPLATIPSQEQVDRAAASFQAFYDGLPEDQQAVIATIVIQAVEAQEQLWPA